MDQQWTTDAIRIITSCMTVIPEKPVLAGGREAEGEIPARKDRVLSYAGYPIAIACPILNQTLVRAKIRALLPCQ